MTRPRPNTYYITSTPGQHASQAHPRTHCHAPRLAATMQHPPPPVDPLLDPHEIIEAVRQGFRDANATRYLSGESCYIQEAHNSASSSSRGLGI